MNQTPTRPRFLYALLIFAVILLGLTSRAHIIQPYLPPFIAEYAGDTLWALLVFLGFGFLWPQLSTWRVAAMACAFSILIEISQLYHAPWIDALRHTRLGGLVLGFGFLWSDLACYAIGVACGAAGEWLCGLGKQRKPA